MSRFIVGADRQQVTLLPECLDAFINALDMTSLGFEGAMPAATGRPSYHPGVLHKLYLYGYLNRIPGKAHAAGT